MVQTVLAGLGYEVFCGLAWQMMWSEPARANGSKFGKLLAGK
jgi:hypothetical protein